MRSEALVQLLNLPHKKVPSRSTFERILGNGVVVAQLEQVVAHLFRSSLDKKVAKPGEIVLAIDGKTVRGTIPKDKKQGVHLMAAYLPAKGLGIAQVAVDTKTNEITAAPQLLAELDLRGMVVVGDAMQAQRKLSAAVVSQQGEYVWLVKDNQPQLLVDLTQLFEPEPLATGAGASRDDFKQAVSWDSRSGRIEKRLITTSSMLEAEYANWPHLEQSFKLESWVWQQADLPPRYEVRYGISSLTTENASARRLLIFVGQSGVLKTACIIGVTKPLERIIRSTDAGTGQK